MLISDTVAADVLPPASSLLILSDAADDVPGALNTPTGRLFPEFPCFPAENAPGEEKEDDEDDDDDEP